MNSKPLKKIFRKLKKKGIEFTHVCEVGVYLPETSNIINFIQSGIRATLVEADPETIKKIKDYFGAYNIELHPVAIWDYNGNIRLSKADASTFVTELKSTPAIVNDQHSVSEENTFEVPCRVFSEIDDGTIDLLSVDIEGAEWYVIKDLKSRPKIISVETHGKYYTNPFINEINNWMLDQNYLRWYKDKSDTVYVMADVFSPNAKDDFSTFLAECALRWEKFKKIFKGKTDIFLIISQLC